MKVIALWLILGKLGADIMGGEMSTTIGQEKQTYPVLFRLSLRPFPMRQTLVVEILLSVMLEPDYETQTTISV